MTEIVHPQAAAGERIVIRDDMPRLSRACRPEHLRELAPWVAEVVEACVAVGLRGVSPHPLRWWEYSTVLRALDVAHVDRQDVVLEVGHGGFRSPLAIALARRGLSVVGLDQDLAATCELEQLAARAGVPTYVWAMPGQIEDLEPDVFAGHFGAVIAVSVVEHLEDDRAALAAMWRLLRPGGVLLLTVDLACGAPADEGRRQRHLYHGVQLIMALRAAVGSFEWLGHAPDYREAEPNVFGRYTFGALCVRKPKGIST